jgi:hypothetical protein
MPTNLRRLDYPSPLRAYRVLHLAADGRVLVTVPVPAESDLEALTMAETLKGEYAVELWDGLLGKSPDWDARSWPSRFR